MREGGETGADGGRLDSSLVSSRIGFEDQARSAERLELERVVQPGIGFPSPSVQTQLMIVRLNLATPGPSGRGAAEQVRHGLRRLCDLFARIDRGEKRILVLDDKTGRPEPAHLREKFSFSATIGFGEGFFDLLAIPAARRPKRLTAMPDHLSLGDTTPYSLAQTDLIIQLGSSSGFVNRWVFENKLQAPEPVDAAGATAGAAEVVSAAKEEQAEDIVSATAGWATIADVHLGFQRTDGRNLQGFNDGVSNPRALSPMFDQVVWSIDETYPALNRGSYMVFQKIVHDLDQWRELDVDEQQEWVGRSKGTGLLLGTLDDKEDAEVAAGLQAGDAAAFRKWKRLFALESHPEMPFYAPELLPKKTKDLPEDLRALDFTIDEVRAICTRTALRVPAWAHVRKVNPRRADETAQRTIFRRGYPFVDRGLDNKIISGLLFISFQSDIQATFEFIKKNWAGNPNFPVGTHRSGDSEGGRRPFNEREHTLRRQSGRLTVSELKGLGGAERKVLGLEDQDDYTKALEDAADPRRQQTGREGLAGPSEHGVTPTGEFLAIVPLGGGYYFVPPIPNRNIEEIGQQFFTDQSHIPGKT